MEPRITLITLGVGDLERSIQFYRDGLGLPKREGPPGVAFFQTRGTWLSLYPRAALAADAGVPAAGSGFPGFASRTTCARRTRSTGPSSRPSPRAHAS